MLKTDDDMGLVRLMVDSARDASSTGAWADAFEYLITILDLEPDNAQANVAMLELVDRLNTALVARRVHEGPPHEGSPLAPLSQMSGILADPAAFVLDHPHMFTADDFFTFSQQQTYLAIARSLAASPHTDQQQLSTYRRQLLSEIHRIHDCISRNTMLDLGAQPRPRSPAPSATLSTPWYDTAIFVGYIVCGFLAVALSLAALVVAFLLPRFVSLPLSPTVTPLLIDLAAIAFALSVVLLISRPGPRVIEPDGVSPWSIPAPWDVLRETVSDRSPLFLWHRYRVDILTHDGHRVAATGQTLEAARHQARSRLPRLPRNS